MPGRHPKADMRGGILRAAWAQSAAPVSRWARQRRRPAQPAAAKPGVFARVVECCPAEGAGARGSGSGASRAPLVFLTPRREARCGPGGAGEAPGHRAGSRPCRRTRSPRCTAGSTLARGEKATVWAASRSGRSAGGHGGWCGHLAHLRCGVADSSAKTAGTGAAVGRVIPAGVPAEPADDDECPGGAPGEQAQAKLLAGARPGCAAGRVAPFAWTFVTAACGARDMPAASCRRLRSSR